MPSVDSCMSFFSLGIMWGLGIGISAWFLGYGLSHMVGLFKGL